MSNKSRPPDPSFDAVIFDMDGVVTNTAKVHAAAWKELFDSYLRHREQRNGEPFRPFDRQADYLAYVDGKPRYEGVRSFLTSRGIELPYGDPTDGADNETICGLGNSKDKIFERLLQRDGPEVFASTLGLIESLKSHGIKVAVVSSSKHCQEILQMAGIEGLFAARVDGVVSEHLGLKGKPDPDIFIKAAEMLHVDKTRSVVVEDAISGVQAGRDGGFGMVIGIDRSNQREALVANGADVVVDDLVAIDVSSIESWFQETALPSALVHREELARRLDGRKAAVFLDYDGTLTPIVGRPELAVMAPDIREAVRRLASGCTTAIVSGRALADVAALVQLEELYYAGNHGFEITGPEGSTILYERGKAFRAAVDGISRRLGDDLEGIDGAFVENKLYSLSVHYRLASAERVPEVQRVVDEALKEFPSLHKRHGKMVFEIRPNIDWDKGKAVLWLLEVLHLNESDVLPFYIGDDITDEDAFRALKGRGIGILVSDKRRPSAADYRLHDTGETKQFLEMLTTLVAAS